MSTRRRRPVVGVCAMDAKARSKPMRAILSRLSATSDFDILVFGDKTIIDSPVSQWPHCDFLIAFHSRGFPTSKVIEYVQEKGVYCVNDVQMQLLLMDRRVVGAVLDAVDVPTPRRMWARKTVQLPVELSDILSRDFGISFNINGDNIDCKPQLIESTVTINSDRMSLPVIEKPADAEDHNINVLLDDNHYIKLFRKIGNKSSTMVMEPSELRDDQDYVYEQYLPSTMDIKVYTVGPYYIYGESRKAPTVDGVVERNADGKEVRQRITLTKQEEEIARRVCMAFGQTVCGLDMIRLDANTSVVIDVNGWSFVKGNDEYYDKCAMILRDTFLRVSRRSMNLHVPLSTVSTSHTGDEWRLERYVAIFRHADRTPKQKFKASIDHHIVSDFMPEGRLLVEVQQYSAIKSLLTKLKPNYTQLYTVIKERVRLPGLKVQLLRQNPLDPKVTVSVKWGGDITHAGRHQARELGDTLRTDLLLLMRAHGISDHDVNILNTETVRVHGGVERRVQATATVFAKALLGTAELPADFVSVEGWQSDEVDTVAAKDIIDSVKKRMSTEHQDKMRELVMILSESAPDRIQTDTTNQWCCGDSPSAFTDRWTRLLSTFTASPSRIFDLYDTLKFDQIHHRRHLQRCFGSNLPIIIDKTQELFELLCASQYGESEAEQLRVAELLSGSLLKSIVNDLVEDSRRFNFYFTKESHVRCLYNLLHRKLQVPLVGELDYLAQLEVEVYARGDNTADKVLRVSVRQGAHLDVLSAGFESGRDHAYKCQQRRVSSPFFSLDEAIHKLESIYGNISE